MKNFVLNFALFQNVFGYRDRNQFDNSDDVDYPADVLEEMKNGGMDISGFGVATSGVENQVFFRNFGSFENQNLFLESYYKRARKVERTTSEWKNCNSIWISSQFSKQRFVQKMAFSHEQGKVLKIHFIFSKTVFLPGNFTFLTRKFYFLPKNFILSQKYYFFSQKFDYFPKNSIFYQSFDFRQKYISDQIFDFWSKKFVFHLRFNI